MNKLIRLVTRRRRLILAFLFFTSLLFGLLNSFPDKYTVLHIANNLPWRICSSKYSIYCKSQDKFALVPAGFPKSGNGLWYKFPGKVWSRDFLPIGNGFLGAMIPGGSNYEIIQLNIESLWTGGPFADPNYNGGNKRPSEASEVSASLKNIHSKIFSSENGTVDEIEELTSDAGAYGSYSGAGYLISTIKTVHPSADVSNFARFLDMDSGRVVSSWNLGKSSYTRESFCSNPTKACVQATFVNNNFSLRFNQTYAFSPTPGLPAPNVTCLDEQTLRVIGTVSEQGGMSYEWLFRAKSPTGTVSCQEFPSSVAGHLNATVNVMDTTFSWVAWVGGTNYDLDAGDEAHNFSFMGPSPYESLAFFIKLLSYHTYASLRQEQEEDYRISLTEKFNLNLGQVPDFTRPTDLLVASYQAKKGDPYLEWLLFNFGRYLLLSSGRGQLPANLQGVWAKDVSNPWNADYHANINLQMNYWAAESTNMGRDVIRPLFDYMEKTWVPRGTYTAQVLYNISKGWAVHNEMNIFGHSGMKASRNSARWSNYPEANAWMMMQVWDHFDYSNDVVWWKSQGYPLLKGVAQFHLAKLYPYQLSDDGSLVTLPCNSPEQIPITLGCAHAQQVIWQLFNAVLKGSEVAGETDMDFLDEVQEKMNAMDKGIHIGSWGQLQEWKAYPDDPDDTHRHLSHLVGLYPGYAIAEYQPTIQNSGRNKFSQQEVLEAARVSLEHRGIGTGPDADSGWEKIWRAACWAQLKDAKRFYEQLTYAIERNFASNLFSLYNPFDEDPIFQIDANLGYPAAVMNALVQNPDVANLSLPLNVILLPALPSAWLTGSLLGVRLRGGLTLDLFWKDSRPTKATFAVDSIGYIPQRTIRIIHSGTEVASFVTSNGYRLTVTKFSF